VRQMMEKIDTIVTRLSKEMDRIAGYCVVGVMLFVVSNILLRKLFNLPIPGAYELVGYLTALAVSLALAYCAVQNGHIGVEYIIDRFPQPLRAGAALVIQLFSACFWSLAAWHTAGYARSLMITGVVSPTAQLPLYPVVYLIALGLLALGLVAAVRFLQRAALLFAAEKNTDSPPQPGLLAEAKEGR